MKYLTCSKPCFTCLKAQKAPVYVAGAFCAFNGL